MKNRSVFCLLFLTFFTNNIYAGQIQVAQWIPWGAVQSQLEQISLNLDSKKENLSMNVQGWNLKLKGTQVLFQGQGLQVNIDESGFRGGIKNFRSEINISEFSIDQVITKKVAGNTLQIHIEALCEPFKILVPQGVIEIQAPFVKSTNSWEPVVSEISIQISPQWELTPIHCLGPQGVDLELTAQIQKAFSDTAVIQNELKKWIAPFLHSTWQTQWNNFLNYHKDSIQGEAIGHPLKQGFYIFGSLTSNTVNNIPRPQLEGIELSLIDPQLIISNLGFSALTEDVIRQQFFKNFELQKIPAFNKLMRSRWSQFFVWPDLMNFAKNAVFNLLTDLKLTKYSLKKKSDQLWSLQVQTGGQLQAERDHSLQNYLKWGVGLSSNVHFDIKEGILTSKLTEQNSNVRVQFEDDYKAQWSPSTYIGKIVTDQAAKALFGSGTSQITLPNLQYKNKLMKLDGWTQQNDSIVMTWKEFLP